MLFSIMCYDTDPDLHDRDPHEINTHLTIQFHDILGEPTGNHSCECVWEGTECCYSFLLNLCYNLPTGLCHLCVSMFWGIEFAYIVFLHAWVATPFVHCWNYLVYIPAYCIRLCVRCVLDPWFEACAYIFMFFERPPEYLDLNKPDRGKEVHRMSIF